MTPNALTKAMRSSGSIANNVAVESVEAERFGEGIGMASTMARLTLTYRKLELSTAVAANEVELAVTEEPTAVSTDELGPRRIVAKFAPKALKSRIIAKLFKLNELECLFFDEVQEKCPVNTPKCYYTAFDPPSQRVVMLLEDLGPYLGEDAKIPNQTVGVNKETALEIFKEISKWHCQYNGMFTKPDKGGMPSKLFASQSQEMFSVFPGVVEGYRKNYPIKFRQLTGGAVPGTFNLFSHTFDLASWFNRTPNFVSWCRNSYESDT
jgi:hypothetical protein